MKEFMEKWPWGLAVLACIVVGAGIYRAHRSAIIPIHHWIGCFLFRCWDCKNHTKKEDSVSPTRWFNALGVKPCRRILAYNILRHDPEFLKSDKEDEEDRLDLKHAEFGLVVMAAEGCFIAAVYALWLPSPYPAWWVWLIASVLIFAASYPAPLQQHATECLRWRAREEKDGAVSRTLNKYGFRLKSKHEEKA